MKITTLFLRISMVLTLVFLCSCKDNDDQVVPPPGVGGGEEPTKMDAWRDAAYGMFIHYGIYSALQGEYIGKDVTGKPVHFETKGNKNTQDDAIKIGAGAGAEWIMYEALIPREEYRKYASLFTASNYDPKGIVSLAQSAGMKYIVITAKHHDGFCLYKSEYTDWNVSQTPAGEKWNNDLIAPLADAAREAGLKFGIYFSHARDWMHEGALGPIPELNKGTYSFADNQKYMNQYTYPMITELLQRYQPDIFWWDSPEVNPYEEFASTCFSLVNNFNPSIVQNNRNTSLSAYPGDYTTPEQSISEFSVDENTELCMTLNSSWGYNEFDDNWKRPELILYNLLRTNKIGGNYLLNIGPRADGSIPERSVEILKEIGEWVKLNEDALYGKRRSPFQYNLPYGPTTWTEVNGLKQLNYHVLYWDGSGELWIPGVMNPAEEVTISIPSAPELSYQVESLNGIGLRVSGLPQEAPSALCTTLQIQFHTDPELDEGIREINNMIYLDALSARISGGIIADWDKKPCFNWYGGSQIDFKFVATQGGTYKLDANLAAHFTGLITFKFSNGTTLQGKNTVTPSGHANFQWQSMGEVTLEPGTYTVEVTSQQSNSWLKLRSFRLQCQ